MFEKKAPRKLITVYLDQDSIDLISSIRENLNSLSSIRDKYASNVTNASIIREALKRGLDSIKKEVDNQGTRR